MKLFSGTACFSPSVRSAAKIAWATHGGTVAETLKERQLSQWFFCSGMADPWLTKFLLVRSGPIVAFHANWILAAVSSSFALPLANYVLDEGYNNINININENIPVTRTESPGSYFSGNLREHPEIDAQINNNSMSTRLATRKRTHESSPEHRFGQENRLVKKVKLQSLFVQDDLATPALPVQTQSRISSLSASGHASSPLLNFASDFSAPSPASLPCSAALHISKAREQSDNHEYSDPGSIISSTSKNNHDLPQLYRELVDKGQVRNDMGHINIVESLNPSPGSPSQLSSGSFGPENAPDTVFAGTTAVQNIWLALIHNTTLPLTSDAAADASGIPTIHVSDALDALTKLSADISSGGNEEVVLFARKRMYRGRKFDVDTADRRKTI